METGKQDRPGKEKDKKYNLRWKTVMRRVEMTQGRGSQTASGMGELLQSPVAQGCVWRVRLVDHTISLIAAVTRGLSETCRKTSTFFRLLMLGKQLFPRFRVS